MVGIHLTGRTARNKRRAYGQVTIGIVRLGRSIRIHVLHLHTSAIARQTVVVEVIPERGTLGIGQRNKVQHNLLQVLVACRIVYLFTVGIDKRAIKPKRRFHQRDTTIVAFIKCEASLWIRVVFAEGHLVVPVRYVTAFDGHTRKVEGILQLTDIPVKRVPFINEQGIRSEVNHSVFLQLERLVFLGVSHRNRQYRKNSE